MLTSARKQLLVHLIAVFLAAFGTQIVGAATVTNESTLVSLLVSAGAAGVAAVAHVLLGLIPTTSVVLSTGERTSALGIPSSVKTAGYQIVVSMVVVFLSIFGASLLTGVAGATSLPGIQSAVIAAISAAVAAVVQATVGLIPTPKT
jgi:hypothetical protein